MTVLAAQMLGPGTLRVASFPLPEPEPGAVVLEILGSGICGTDKHTWRGESLQYAGTAHERRAAYPLICGHENVGVIEALGPGAPPLDQDGRPLGIGDRVVPAPNLVCGRCYYCLPTASTARGCSLRLAAVSASVTRSRSWAPGRSA